MSLFAKLDPFGMAAFLEQTRYWTAEERNSRLISLSGNFLFNRALWTTLSTLTLLYAYFRYSFRKLNAKKNNYEKETKPSRIVFSTGVPSIEIQTLQHNISVFFSHCKLALSTIFKGIPFIIVIILFSCLLVIELSNSLSGDPRLGANFARTGLIVSVIMETIPFFCLLIILFYSNEIGWKSRDIRFSQLEDVSPANKTVILLSRIASVSLLPLILITYSILLGLLIQTIKGYNAIDIKLYASLFYFTGLPLIISTVLITIIQTFSKYKYTALAFAIIFVLLLNTRLGLMIGITHPLLRFGNSFSVFYGDMNGFGSYPLFFHLKMLFGISIASLAIIIITNRLSSLRMITFYIFLMSAVLTGEYIIYEANIKYPVQSDEEINNWKQKYEETYKKYTNYPTPSITNVKADIALYPAKQYYEVSGTYTIINKTQVPINRLLLHIPEKCNLISVSITGGELLSDQHAFQHLWYKMKKEMLPGDSITMTFHFTSGWSVFESHTPYNSIIQNGSFMRISRYFPKFGYSEENEITNSIERKKRNMADQTPLKKLEEPVAEPYNYQFINLSMTVSTEADQTVVCSGDLIKQWKANNRNYFTYTSDRPIPFRFAVSSARYLVKRDFYRNVPIEVYFDERHSANVAKLISDAKKTLNYCENNFSPFPHKVIRFAEISSFAEGFAATAYPNVIYMKENSGFFNNLSVTGNHDVINSLAAHELSHQWWGSSQIAPEYKEGGWLLTETLANYTALMLYKRTYGSESLREIVRQHIDLYLSNRSFSKEPPLYKTDFQSPHLAYNKGLVIFYQLELLLGENVINKALANILRKHAYPNIPPSSQDLLDELIAAAPESENKIKPLFTKVNISDISLDNPVAKEKSGRYELQISGKAIFIDETNIEVEVITYGNKRNIYTCPVKNGKFLFTAELNSKPIKLVLDPNFRTIDIFPKDNEKNVEIIK